MRKWSRNPPQLTILRLQIKRDFSADAGSPGGLGDLRGPPDHHIMTRRANALGVTLPVPRSLAQTCVGPKHTLNFEKMNF